MASWDNAGQPPDELQDLQDSCSGDMNMMRHCRQCRADAVGMLGEDRGDEFTLDKIEDMEIDYASAMEKRKVIHQAIQAEMDSKRLEKAEKAQQHKRRTQTNNTSGIDGRCHQRPGCH